MIVRIATEGQYELSEADHEELNRLDNATVEAVESGDEASFRSAFDALLGFVRERGSRVGADDLHESEVIIPPPDLTLEEAGETFTGDGLLPD